MFHRKTKQIDTRCRFIHEVIIKEKIIIKKTGNTNNPAAMLTKSLPVVKFRYFLNLISVHDI